MKSLEKRPQDRHSLPTVLPLPCHCDDVFVLDVFQHNRTRSRRLKVQCREVFNHDADVAHRNSHIINS